MNLISGKEFKANTICLPFDEKPNERYLDATCVDDKPCVTVAGWGLTQDGKLLLWCIRNHVVNNLNTFILKKHLIIIWKFIRNLFSAILSSLADQLQKLVTKVMPYAKCEQAHAKSYSPVLEANNVCAGGEKGIVYCFIIIAVFNFEYLMNEFQCRLIIKHESIWIKVRIVAVEIQGVH